jgi:hypothetical protein
MKGLKLIPVYIFVLAILLSACVPYNQPVQNQVSEAYIQTAVASTLMAERGLAAGAALSVDATTEDGTPTTGTPGTPQAEETPDPTEETDPEPTLEDPWMLQSWCKDHMDGCVFYDLNNRTDSWLQVELRESETGVTGFFSIKSKTMGRITMIPGYYQVKYTWWCSGESKSLIENKGIGSWIDEFKCPQGFYRRINK